MLSQPQNFSLKELEQVLGLVEKRQGCEGMVGGSRALAGTISMLQGTAQNVLRECPPVYEVLLQLVQAIQVLLEEQQMAVALLRSGEAGQDEGCALLGESGYFGPRHTAQRIQELIASVSGLLTQKQIDSALEHAFDEAEGVLAEQTLGCLQRITEN
ncbi:MAG: hypothetical protein JXR59_02025 [Desulfuromonadaceae bacterium]|nr:hypothetical protein [Desulfuromonadaceae bacterium]